MLQRASQWSSDLQDRAAVASKAAADVRAAPKETKEWTEAGWWKCGGPAPSNMIPGAALHTLAELALQLWS